MKYGALILGLICISGIVSYGQDSKTIFFDEFHLSLNRTTVKDENTKDMYGFGFGACHSFFPFKRLNIILGIEYNQTNQFKKNMYEGHFANATDLTYNLNCISIPMGLRVNIGSKTKVFIETGGFADIVVSSTRKGTMINYYPYGSMGNKNTEINEKAGLLNTFGIYIGLGLRIPISRFELVVNPEYKLGVKKLHTNHNDIFNRYFRVNIGLKIK